MGNILCNIGLFRETDNWPYKKISLCKSDQKLHYSNFCTVELLMVNKHIRWDSEGNDLDFHYPEFEVRTVSVINNEILNYIKIDIFDNLSDYKISYYNSRFRKIHEQEFGKDSLFVIERIDDDDIFPGGCCVEYEHMIKFTSEAQKIIYDKMKELIQSIMNEYIPKSINSGIINICCEYALLEHKRPAIGSLNLWL